MNQVESFGAKNLKEVLEKVFHHSSFRPGQQEIIQSILGGNDTLVIKPTGGGKSLCYQLPSYFLEGLTLVISPLISLMEDQINEARKQGRRDVISFHSGYSSEEKEIILANLEQYKLLYISPEGLQNTYLQEKLKKRKVSLLVVDEAHCISQWGHDFRMEYLDLARLRSLFLDPPCLAVTATATPEVKKDIIQYLNLRNVQEFIESVDRPNIAIFVEKVDMEKQKDQKILEFLQQRQDAGMIYFSSRAKAEEFTFFLQSHGIQDVAFYHGGMSAEDRYIIQQQFLTGELKIICATNAFGMGVNKSNIRYVIHYHFPSYIESYVQEMGRCSRDGKPGLSYVFYQQGDEQIPYRFVEQEFLNQEQLHDLIQLFHFSSQRQEPLALADIYPSVECSEQALHFILFHLERLKLGVFHKVQQEIEINKSFQAEHVFSELSELVDRQKGRRRKKISDMYYWLNLSDGECRRKFILQYFGEGNEAPMQPDVCCDLCGLPQEWVIIDIDDQQSNQKSAKELSLEQKIDRLWPIESVFKHGSKR